MSATFNLSWTPSIGSKVRRQSAQYRKQDETTWITSGFTPKNDLIPGVSSASVSNLSANTVYQFRVQTIIDGIGIVDGTTVEKIVFECNPITISYTDVDVTVVIPTTSTLSKLVVTVKKQSDDSVVTTHTETGPLDALQSITLTGLTAGTAYYITYVMYAVVNSVEVASSAVAYLNGVCGGNITGYKFTTESTTPYQAVSSLTITT